MVHTAAQVEALLRERGFALTSQRRAIIGVLAESGGHWSAADVLARVGGIDAGDAGAARRASRATVYSTLTLLRDLGAIAELPLPGGDLVFDADPEPHQHLWCQSCGRLWDVAEHELPARLANPADRAFRVERFRVVAEGVCGDCG